MLLNTFVANDLYLNHKKIIISIGTIYTVINKNIIRIRISLATGLFNI